MYASPTVIVGLGVGAGASAGGLAATGSPIGWFVAAALSLLFVGLLLLRLGHRRVAQREAS